MTDIRSYQPAPDSVIAFLVRKSADINAKDLYGSTPLHFAAMRGNETAVLDLLCQTGINIEVRKREEREGRERATYCSDAELCPCELSIYQFGQWII